MNLRHLVITVDPDSLTHPKRVLDRWRDRIKIEVWEDDRFISQDYDATVKHMSGEHKDPKLIGHRVRQASFNLECLKHLKRENREWVIMLDTDEYLTMNPNLRDSDTYSYDLPGLDKPGSLFKLLDQIIIPNPDFDELNTPCIPVFRQQFAARESDDHQVNAMVPSGFHGKNFQTLRWRKYGYPDFWYETKWGEECHVKRWVPNKVLIDLGRIRLVDIDHPDNQGNPHRPLRSVCTGDLYIKAPKTPFAANHYMGTLEQWLYRVGDKRGEWASELWCFFGGGMQSTHTHTHTHTPMLTITINLSGQGYRLARYEDLNFWIGEHESDQLRPWLQGFVATIGENEASRLLDGVGILEPLPHHEKYIPKEEPNSTHGEEVVYHVGDVVQANYKGDGYWLWAEVSKVHSNGYYDVLFAEDCTEEIATFGARLRRKGKSDDALNDTEFQMLIHDRL